MKNSIYIVVALLAGLVIGNFSTRPDLRQAREEINSLKQQLNVRGRRDDNLRSVTSMLRVSQPEAVIVTNTVVVSAPGQTAGTASGAVAAVTNQAVATSESRRSAREQMEQAIELWKTRSELARNSFLSNLTATPDQTQVFDRVITNMNTQLAEKIRQWTDYIRQQPDSDLTPETSVRLMHDLGTTVLSAYDELDAAFPADWRDKAGTEFQLFDFINPEVGLPFAELQDSLGNRRRSQREAGRAR